MLDKKTIFLFDGMGALFSAIFTGVMLSHEPITFWGILILVMEIVIVLLVVALEIRIYRSPAAS